MRKPRAPESPEVRARRREYLAQWRREHPEEYKAQQERAHARRMQNRDKLADVNRRTRERLGPEYWRAWHQNRKRTVIDRYGGRCECCGETEIEFLSMDHINGGGTRERIALGSGRVFMRLFKSEERLPGFQVLCMNCQFGTARNRTCPHQITRRDRLKEVGELITDHGAALDRLAE